MNYLDICKKTRKIAADSLYLVLKKILMGKNPISEIQFRDRWLKELRKHKEIFPDGWYMPPPHGMAVLFATDKNIERVNYKNLREETIWPRNDMHLNTSNGLIYCFASPVDRKTGIIGDFGVSLYFGKNNKMQELLQMCLLLNKEFFHSAHIGMRLKDIYAFAQKLFDQNNLSNEIVSITDPRGVNIGHTIPGTDRNWKVQERGLLNKAQENWNDFKNMISSMRKFINSQEEFSIASNTAITIEPRPKMNNKPHLPSSLSYHTIALYKENGEKELLTNFDELFKIVGMNYMLE